jgi:hypothetical protein
LKESEVIMPQFPPPPPSEGDFPPPPPDDVPPPPPPSGDNTAWTPPPSPPAGEAAAPVSKNIPNVPVVRQPMSRNAKLNWVTAILLVALGYGGYQGYRHLNRYPKETAVRNFVEKQLAIPGQKVVDVSAKPVASGSSSGGFNLIGKWHGQMSDGTALGDIFQNNNNVTIQIDNVNFPGSYALRQSSPYWEIDIKDLKNGSYNGTTVTVPSYLNEGTVRAILQPISADSFKIEYNDTGDARPTTFDKDAIVMTRTGTAPAASAQNNTPAPPPVGVRLAFTATLEMTEPLFAKIPVEQYMQQQGADPMVFHKIQSILNGPNAARLREISGVSDPVTNFTGKTIVRETFSPGHRYTSSGVIKAIRQDGKWQLTLVSGPNPDKDAPAFGYSLSDFKGEVLSTNQPDQLKEINDLISRANDTLQKLQQAQEQNRQEMLAAQKAARLAAQREAQQKRAAAEAARQQPQSATGSSVNAAPAQTPAAAAAVATNINNGSVSSGTSITVSTLDMIDTSSSLQPFYRATTTRDINLSDGTTIPAGSDAKLIVFANGANYQMRLDSLAANGKNIPLNTDTFNVGTVGQGSSPVKIGFGGVSFDTGGLFKSGKIKPGKLYTFHQQ